MHFSRLAVAFVLLGCSLRSRNSIVAVESRVILGNEVLRRDSFSALHGERVTILTNPSGIFPDTLQHIVDFLHFDTNVSIAAVLAPEHGFRGDHQAEAGDPDSYIDSSTNLTVYSVYRKNQSDIQGILSRTNTSLLLVDIQDVGTRLYTFVWTMFDVLEAIAVMTTSVQDARWSSQSTGAWCAARIYMRVCVLEWRIDSLPAMLRFNLCECANVCVLSVC